MLQNTGEKTVGSSVASSSSSSFVDLAGSKLRKKLGSSLQESVAAPISDFARKQLAKMGWTEGTGLGKREMGSKLIFVSRNAKNRLALAQRRLQSKSGRLRKSGGRIV